MTSSNPPPGHPPNFPRDRIAELAWKPPNSRCGAAACSGGCAALPRRTWQWRVWCVLAKELGGTGFNEYGHVTGKHKTAEVVRESLSRAAGLVDLEHGRTS